MAQLHWTIDAQRELLGIGAFIATDSPRAAASFVRRLVESTERLRSFPESGRVVPEARNERLRELIVRRHRIVYVWISDDVYILAVVDGAMDMNRRLAAIPPEYRGE